MPAPQQVSHPKSSLTWVHLHEDRYALFSQSSNKYSIFSGTINVRSMGPFLSPVLTSENRRVVCKEMLLHMVLRCALPFNMDHIAAGQQLVDDIRQINSHCEQLRQP